LFFKLFISAHISHVARIRETSMWKYDMHYLYPRVTSALSILLLQRQIRPMRQNKDIDTV